MPSKIYRFGLALTLLAGCGGGGLQAESTLEPKSGSTVTGYGLFTFADGKTTFELEVSGATPGPHGVHLHEVGDCSSEDGMSAGPHWNPLGSDHGNPSGAPHHYGDAGNIEIGADGTGTLVFETAEWQIASTSTVPDVVGHAIIFHEKVDDFSQPAGNAGARQACGVIRNKL